jgi:hypothetical protein
MTTTLFLIAGTHGGAWAQETDPQSFRVFLRLMGFRCSRIEWSENVDGVPDLLAAAGNRDWISGGYAVRYRLRDVPYEDRNFITHSHGIGPLLYSTTFQDADEPPVPIRNALCICPPPREEFIRMATTALETGMLASLRVIYADGWDLWARLGQIGDGHWGWRRSWDLHDPRFVQHGIKGIGHSGVFEHGRRGEIVGDIEDLKVARMPRAGSVRMSDEGIIVPPGGQPMPTNELTIAGGASTDTGAEIHGTFERDTHTRTATSPSASRAASARSRAGASRGS